ncbi:MAG: hypothetical protein LBN95_13175 [Prevotellaceae bacterium]|nr:hypothetical protein [Prevotellaceae bacterium]
MKKLKNFFGVAILATVTFTACKTPEPSSNNNNNVPESVVINGIKWATRNVDEVGIFAAKPESAGKFYQWNRKIAWAATGDEIGWNATDAEGTTWDIENDPSPKGYRVPTLEEFETLLDTEKVRSEIITQNSVKGALFKDVATGNTLFLPAAGYRNGNNAEYVGNRGVYWSSSIGSNYGEAYDLYFISNVSKFSNQRRYGFLFALWQSKI